MGWFGLGSTATNASVQQPPGQQTNQTGQPPELQGQQMGQNGQQTGQQETNKNKIITFDNLTPQQQTKLQSLGITSNNVKNKNKVEHSAIPFQSFSTELLLDTTKQQGQPQNLIYMGKVWKSTLPQNQQVQPVQQTSTNNKSNNNRLLNTYQGTQLLPEEKYVFMLDNGDFVLNKLILVYSASSNIKCKLRMKDGKPEFKYINKEKTNNYHQYQEYNKKNIANNLFYYIFDIDDAQQPASTGWGRGSWFGSPQAQPAPGAQPAAQGAQTAPYSWWGGKKNIKIKKPKSIKKIESKSIKEKSKSKKVESKSIKEKPKTKKVNSKTMKEKPKKVNSKTMKEKSKKVNSKTMKEKSKSKKVNSKTMKEKSKTIKKTQSKKPKTIKKNK
jgi:hypothetical protein